jgi:hypothetical protein
MSADVARGERAPLWRSRWAAIGAAIAVSLGAGGLFVSHAAPGSSESTIVSVTPERILDTRDPNNVGLGGPFVSAVSQKLQVTGSIPTATGTKTVVPTGATGVLLNVTPVNATADGFISIRPGDATGTATTSSLNFTRGDILPNAVQVAVPTAGSNTGQIDITYDAYGQAGPTTDILIDVVGYMTSAGLQELVADVASKADAVHGHDDRYYTEAETDALLAAPEVHQLEFPIGSLVEDAANTVIESRISGYDWENSGAEAASLNLARPDDWDGTSPVVIRVFYLRSVSADGEVRFFVRPRSFEVGETWLDKAGIGATAPSVSGIVFQRIDITIPAVELQKSWWNLSLQRTPLSYTGSVLVYALTMTYTG